MCIPPHWEHRRAEIAQLEPIDLPLPERPSCLGRSGLIKY